MSRYALDSYDKLENLRRAQVALRDVQSLVTPDVAPKTAARIRLAMSSIKGAIRNAESRRYRDARKWKESHPDA